MPGGRGNAAVSSDRVIRLDRLEAEQERQSLADADSADAAQRLHQRVGGAAVTVRRQQLKRFEAECGSRHDADNQPYAVWVSQREGKARSARKQRNVPDAGLATEGRSPIGDSVTKAMKASTSQPATTTALSNHAALGKPHQARSQPVCNPRFSYIVVGKYLQFRTLAIYRGAARRPCVTSNSSGCWRRAGIRKTPVPTSSPHECSVSHEPDLRHP